MFIDELARCKVICQGRFVRKRHSRIFARVMRNCRPFEGQHITMLTVQSEAEKRVAIDPAKKYLNVSHRLHVLR